MIIIIIIIINARIFFLYDLLGRTPLHLAFIHMDIVPHMRKMLDIYKKVKKFIQDKKKAEALENDVARSVQKYGGNNTDSASKDWIAQAVRIYLEHKQQKGQQKKASLIGDDGVSAMDEDIIIIEQDEISTVELYSQFQWEVDSAVPSKVDPIDIIKFFSKYDELRYDIADEFGRTPLHYAATVGAFSSTSVLLAEGVNINAQDLDRNTPLQLALRYKHVDYSVMLCDQGATPSSLMTLPVGDSITTLNYSLSQDFMNMAYLILDRDPNILGMYDVKFYFLQGVLFFIKIYILYCHYFCLYANIMFSIFFRVTSRCLENR